MLLCSKHACLPEHSVKSSEIKISDPQTFSSSRWEEFISMIYQRNVEYDLVIILFL